MRESSPMIETHRPESTAMKHCARHTRSIVAMIAFAGLSAAALTSCGRTTDHNGAASSSASAQSPAAADWPGGKPTIVLVHGAWADAAGWTPVITDLQKAGFPVKALVYIAAFARRSSYRPANDAIPCRRRRSQDLGDGASPSRM
ncbi:hypothetical protein [Nocardia sp. NPDC020380]|uniref:hypothetical protein n=1 Tax=Nocardia sp. NPDC020380 TaxID=3364309 RepID=UPI0037AE3E22